MSERIFFTPSEPEDDPSIAMTLPEGTEVILQRTNSAVYSYLGNIAMFNHVYFLGSEGITPFYLFQEFLPPEDFDKLKGAMSAFQFPHFDNQGWVDETDIAAYEAHAKNSDKSSLEDIVDSWTSSEE